MGKVIAVVSGKGGVGKSTVAACLACCLSEVGKRVLAVDCDFGFRNLDMLLNIEDKLVYDIGDALRGEDLNKCIIKTNGNRPYFMASCTRVDSDIDQTVFCTLINKLAQNSDYVILDASAGIGNSFACCIAAADLCLLVTTPDRTALRDAERVAYILSLNKTECRLIVNRVCPKHIKAGYIKDMDYIIDYVGVRLIGLLPDDRKLPISQNMRQNPLDNHRREFTKAFVSMVAKIEGKPGRLYRFW